MALRSLNAVDTTGLADSVQTFSVAAQHPDAPLNLQAETYWDFPNAAKYLGYYKTIPELKKAIDALAIWTVGKGYMCDNETKVKLWRWNGNGSDTVDTILFNLQARKKYQGDAFAEIIWDEDKLWPINLKPLFTGDVRVVYNSKGTIEYYEHRLASKNGKYRRIDIENMFHYTNDRVENEMHGVSIIDAVQWVIDARNEALNDKRVIMHRSLALGVLEIDSDNPTKRAEIKAKYSDAVKNGEVLVLPKGTAELKDAPQNDADFISWIQYLENAFYQAVGVPRVIATSENYTEASSKVGYMTFEPIYTREQKELEAQLWKQLRIKVAFNRPPSLAGVMASDESKNTGQTSFQPSDMKLGAQA